MLEAIMWILLVFVTSYSIWYNYHHFKRLLTGKITLTEVLIALGSIGAAIILFVIVIIMRIL